MSQAVAVTEPRPNLVVGHRPMAIVPTSMDEAYRLGKAIVISGMAPRGMDTPEKCMIAIMRGMEVGLTPMQAVDKIAVVNGRPTIWGDGAMGLVRGSGLCEWVKEETTGTGDVRAATCTVMRRGEPAPISRTFSVADAKKAQLWGKSGPWQQFPDRMLQMRARAFALRDLFADVLGGLYLREEIEDEAPEQKRRRTPPPAPEVTAQRETPQIEGPKQEAAAAAAEPAQVEEAEVVEQEVVPSEASKPAETVEPQGHEGGAREADTAAATKVLWALSEALKEAIDEEDVESIYSEVDAEPELSEIEGYVEKARALKADRLAEIAKHAAPADRFVIPVAFDDAEQFQAFLADARAATVDKETAEKLKVAWADALAYGKREKLPEDMLRKEMNTCLEKMGEFLPRQERKKAPPAAPAQEPAAEVDFPLDKEPATAAEYLALVRARAKGTDYDTVKGYRSDYMAEAGLRKRLGVAQADLEPVKAALWARADEIKG